MKKQLSEKDKATAKIVTDFAIHFDVHPDDMKHLLDALIEDKTPITPANLLTLYKRWVEANMERESKITVTRVEIDSWPSSVLSEKLKDPELAEQINYILSKPVEKKEEPKAAPAPKFKPPVRTPEEQAIEGMSADQMKRAIAKGQGPAIENVLAAAARRKP